MTTKNTEIEALRGIAIIWVIISHLGNLMYWVPGLGEKLSHYGFAAGVDLFFVISGYVITNAFHAELSAAKRLGMRRFVLASRAFMLRRFFRVMPAALVWILIVCACSIWFNTTTIFGTLQGNFADFVSVAFNVSNIHFADCITNNNPPGQCGYNGVYWSISLEEQFYFVFPLLVFLRPRAVIVIALAVTTWLIYQDRTLLVWFTRVDGLLAGVCLAFATSTKTYERLAPTFMSNVRTRVLMLALLTAAVIALPVAAKSILPRLWPELIVLCCLAMVAAATYNRGFTFAPGAWRSCLQYVGGRSFSLYLVHNPAAWIMRETAAQLGYIGPGNIPVNPAAFTACAFILMFALAELTYRLIEVPWRKWGRGIAAMEDAPASPATGLVGLARPRPAGV